MNSIQPLTKLPQALLKAQKAMGAAKKDATNPYFKSKYADLNSIMEVCKGPLNDNGIVVLQPVGHDEHGDYVETILLHESGEFISDKIRLIATSKPQEQGSVISYARRYSLQSLVFIPAEDDDGNTASKPQATVTTQGDTVTITDTPTEKCPECYATRTPFGKMFHKNTCSRKEMV